MYAPHGLISRLIAKLGHGWVIAPHFFVWLYILIPVLNPMVASLISVSTRGPWLGDWPLVVHRIILYRKVSKYIWTNTGQMRRHRTTFIVRGVTGYNEMHHYNCSYWLTLLSPWSCVRNMLWYWCTRIKSSCALMIFKARLLTLLSWDEVSPCLLSPCYVWSDADVNVLADINCVLGQHLHLALSHCMWTSEWSHLSYETYLIYIANEFEEIPANFLSMK